ncbi:hypothetical protein [Anaerosporobacter sp.]
MREWSNFNKILFITFCTGLILGDIILCIFSESLFASFVTSLLAIASGTIFYCFIGMIDCREKMKNKESSNE